MKNFIISTILIFASCGSTFAQTPHDVIEKVKEIKLLVSTRNDVQRSLINYESEDYDFEDHSQDFYSDFADIEVSYSSGKCQEDVATADGEDDEEDYGDDVAEIWNVAEWKATKIVINFDEAVKINDVGFDLADFKKQKRFPDEIDRDKNSADDKNTDGGNVNSADNQISADTENSTDDESADDEDSTAYIYHSKSLGIALIGDEKEIEKIIFYPSKSSHSKLCDNKKAKKFASDENWFGIDELRRIVDGNGFANVTDLILSAEEITSDCSEKTKNKNRPEKVNKISVKAVAVDPENDVVTYNYTVSGGKIVGRGAEVFWDLTGVEPGTYTITAGVDDGCGVCGQTKTKTVIVKENKSCNQKNETILPPKISKPVTGRQKRKTIQKI